MQNPSKKYQRISDAYEYFAQAFDADFSERARIEFYNYETFGSPVIKYNEKYNGQFNGFAIGKHWMDVNLAMYREDLQSGNLKKFELLGDPRMPQLIKDIIETIYIPMKRDSDEIIRT